MAFFDRILVCLGTLTEVLTNQERKFLKIFEALYTKTLIDHCTTSKSHLEANSLVEEIVQSIKHDL